MKELTSTQSLLGVVFAYLSDELEFRQKICLVMAFLLLREPATSAGIFLASFALSKQWTKDDKPNPITEAFQRGNSKTDLRAAKATELVSYLDCVLEWEEAYFQEFTFWFLKSFKNIDVAMKNMSTTSTNDDHHQQKMGPGALSESVSSSSFENANVSQVSLNSHETNEDDSAASSSSSEVEVMLKYLSSYYSSDIAINDYKLALADFRLALAEYNLSMVSHRINCFNCRNGLPCTEDNRFPSQLSMGASTNSLALDGVDEEGEEEEMDNDDDDDKLDLNKYGHVAIPNVEDDIIAQLHLQE